MYSQFNKYILKSRICSLNLRRLIFPVARVARLTFQLAWRSP